MNGAAITSLTPQGIDHSGPMDDYERKAMAALSLAHPCPIPMMQILRGDQLGKDALCIGMGYLRCRGWVRVRGLSWSLTTRGLNEAPNHPDLVAARRAMN